MEKISGPRKGGRYLTNQKALRRWSEERLEIKFLDDGSVEAKFLYDGTTCSNFGHPLAYQYIVKLATSDYDFRIEEMHCATVDGDVGHQKMCECIKDPQGLQQLIQEEKPLLGRPLNDVLDWNRPFAPAGCYCQRDSRMHKWGSVLETIHFALMQRAPYKLNS